jgi:hypothetical protein
LAPWHARSHLFITNEMKKIILQFIVYITCFSLTGICQKQIQVHEKSNTQAAYSQFFKAAKLVKLETNPGCLISNVSELKTDTDRIFIYDARLGSVFIFTNNGHFLVRIGVIGKGPGEMITPRGFTLDKKLKQIELLDFSGRKILQYDYNGNYIKSQDAVFTLSFEKIKDSNYIGYSYGGPFADKGKPIQSDLAIFNANGQFIKQFEIIRRVPRRLSFATSTNMVIDENAIAYIIPIYENSLFRVTQSINIEKICDFVFDTKIPKGILEDLGSFDMAAKVFSQNNYPFLVQSLCVINNRVNFTFRYDHQINHTFWKIGTDAATTVKSSNFINDMAIIKSREFKGIFDEGIIDVVEASDFIENFTKAIEEDKELSTIQPFPMRKSLVELAKEISINDNPILIFYSYK